MNEMDSLPVIKQTTCLKIGTTLVDYMAIHSCRPTSTRIRTKKCIEYKGTEYTLVDNCSYGYPGEPEYITQPRSRSSEEAKELSTYIEGNYSKIYHYSTEVVTVVIANLGKDIITVTVGEVLVRSDSPENDALEELNAKATKLCEEIMQMKHDYLISLLAPAKGLNTLEKLLEEG